MKLNCSCQTCCPRFQTRNFSILKNAPTRACIALQLSLCKSIEAQRRLFFWTESMTQSYASSFRKQSLTSGSHTANTISWAGPLFCFISFYLLALPLALSLSTLRPFLRVFNTNADSRLFIRYCLDFLVNMTLLLLRRARWRIEPLYSVRCVPGTDQTWTPYPGLYYFPLQSTARFFPRRRNSTRTSIWPNTIQSLIKWTSWHTKKSSSCSVCINSPIFYEHDRWKRCSL
jgi:hypothetical protein